MPVDRLALLGIRAFAGTVMTKPASHIPSNPQYKLHQIKNLKFISFLILQIIFAQSIQSRVLSWEWRCSWNSADKRCSNYIWVINNFIAHLGVTYFKGLTVHVYMEPALWRVNSLTPGRFLKI